MQNIKKPELMSPAGDWTSLCAAINAGTDAIYFGIKGANMRATAKNFELNQLPKITEFCHKKNIKSYLTINTIIYNEELQFINRLLKKAKLASIDAIICWDMGVVSLAKKLDIPIFLSTQASVANSKALEFYNK